MSQLFIIYMNQISFERPPVLKDGFHFIYKYTVSPLTLRVWIPLMRSLLDTTLCDQVCQLLATGRWFSPSSPVSSINKTDRHDITEILLKVALNTITQTSNPNPYILLSSLLITLCYVHIRLISHVQKVISQQLDLL
jgi:hypothetical protein